MANGKTSLGKSRLPKNDPLIVALGDLDELSSFLGLGRAFSSDAPVANELKRAQKNLYLLGALVSGFEVPGSKATLERETRHLETLIKKVGKKLVRLSGFIYPAGAKGAAFLFVARAVCRRAERSLWSLKGFEAAAVYLNRLSDYLFLAARQANLDAGQPEDSVEAD